MTSIAGRLLRRFRPLDKPARQRRDPEQRKLSSSAADAVAVIAAFPPRGAPIRPITRAEFDEMVRTHPYYEGRWRYTSIALAQAANLITGRGLRNALELGAPVRPVIVGADVMDMSPRPDLQADIPSAVQDATLVAWPVGELQADIPVTIHDATDIPWPVDDKAYDLFLALQVFEHLDGKQPQAFLEVRRIARHAIISLPIDWVTDDPSDCHHQISHERVLSWFAPVAPTRVVQGSGGAHKRLIYVFEDLPAPA